MKNTFLLLSFVLVGLLCVTVQAEIAPEGFQGTFGDANAAAVSEEFGLTEGVTTGSTASSGITASFNSLIIDLADFVENGDAVSVSNLVLSGFDDCSGIATYVWNDATLFQYVSSPQFSLGAVTGTLTLQNSTLAVSETSTSGTGALLMSAPILVDLPQQISLSLSYNGAIVASDGMDGYVTTFSPSASFSAESVPVPEPSTIVCLLAGLGTLLIWRRK